MRNQENGNLQVAVMMCFDVLIMECSDFELYFREPVETAHSELNELLQCFTNFFQDDNSNYTQRYRLVTTTKESLYSCISKEKLDKYLLQCPSTVLTALSFSASQVLNLNKSSRGSLHIAQISDWNRGKFINDLGAEDINTLLKIPGIVSSVEFISNKLIKSDLICTKCGKEYRSFVDKANCPNCKSPQYTVIDKEPILEFQQFITINQIGKHECSLRCKLVGDNVNTCTPGDLVEITGIVKLDPSYQKWRNFKLIFEANFVKNIGNANGGYASFFMKNNDISQIKALALNEYLYPTLVYSVAPFSTISPMVKAVLLLVCASNQNDNLHVLISQSNLELLQSTANALIDFFPHLLLIHEDSQIKFSSQINKCSIDAGAFAISNRGLLIIDDFDKFKQTQFVYKEVIETNSERIDSTHSLKSIFSSIILAHPDEYAKLDESVITSFDFIATIDEDKESSRRRVMKHLTPKSTPIKCNVFEKWDNKFLPFNERIEIKPEISSSFRALNSEQMLKFITYARQFVHPQWSRESKEILRNIVKSFNEIHGSSMKYFVTLKKMAQCRARLELRENIIEDDIKEVAEILWWCHDNSPQRSQRPQKKNNRKASSKQKLVSDFISEFKRMSKYRSDGNVTAQEMKNIYDICNISTRFQSYDQFIDLLSSNNYILQSAPRLYRLGNA